MTDAPTKASDAIAAAAPDATVSAPKAQSENAIPAGDPKAEVKSATPEGKPLVAPAPLKI
jgi:hypothetical protein